MKSFFLFLEVEYDFAYDFITVANYIAGSNNLTDEYKAAFITYTIEEMALHFDIILNNGTALQISKRKDWFKNKCTGNIREYLILGHDDDNQPALYCIYCLSYSGKEHTLCKTGLKINNSSYVLQAIIRHERAKYHKDSFEKYLTALNSNGDKRKEKIKRNRYIVQKIIEVVIFVATSGSLKLIKFVFLN